MKIEIDYFVNTNSEFPCGARSEYQGNGIYGAAKTWEEARERLLENLKQLIGANIPKRETVELAEDEDGEALRVLTSYGNSGAALSAADAGEGK